MKRLVWVIVVLLLVALAGGAAWDVSYAAKVRPLHDRLMAEVDVQSAMKSPTAMMSPDAGQMTDRAAAMTELHGIRPPFWKKSAQKSMDLSLQAWQAIEPTILLARMGNTPEEALAAFQTAMTAMLADPRMAPYAGAMGDMSQMSAMLRPAVDKAFADYEGYKTSRSESEASYQHAVKIYGLF